MYNPQRIIRALEVCIATNKPYSYFRKGPSTPRPFSIIKIGLCMDRTELYQRINQRVDQMLEQGFLEEATKLYPYRSYNALQTLGYQELFNYLTGDYDLQEAILRIKRNTRRYAKRQITWFKSDSTIYWSHPDSLINVINYITQQTKDKK